MEAAYKNRDLKKTLLCRILCDLIINLIQCCMYDILILNSFKLSKCNKI